MSVRVEGPVIFLEGQCHVEQAEQLLQRLQEDPDRRIDLSACRHLHTAVVQVLLSHGARVSGDPVDPFLRQFVAPCFQRSESPT
jgi:hypothetical protein